MNLKSLPHNDGGQQSSPTTKKTLEALVWLIAPLDHLEQILMCQKFIKFQLRRMKSLPEQHQD